MTAVLPTPAPPNSPILPPFTNGADLVAADMLLDFRDELAVIEFHGHRVVQLGQLLGLELDVEDGSDDLDHFADAVLFLSLGRHVLSFERLRASNDLRQLLRNL